MTTHMHAGSAATRSRTGFGFEAIMAEPDYAPFRSWWNDTSYFALTRDDIESAFSSPEDAEEGAVAAAWTALADAA